MISEQPKQLLIAQVAHELSAHQTYMGIALHFERESLKGWAKFFRDQATEEAGHAWKYHHASSSTTMSSSACPRSAAHRRRTAPPAMPS